MKVTPVTVYLPDQRDVTISRFGKGNCKIGANVYTYSLPAPECCPGQSVWCRKQCYARRIDGPVSENYCRNWGPSVPPLPSDCCFLRLHVSGDFYCCDYIEQWRWELKKHPEVTAWAYTRSWRFSHLLEELELLRELPNVQILASMDESITELPPAGWRVAWIEGDPRAKGIVCPEEKRHVRDCEECGFCFNGKYRGDVTFLKH